MKKRRSLFILTGIFVLFLGFYCSVNEVSATPTTVAVIVDGKQLVFDVPPKIVNGRLLVPLRAIFEALEAQVDYESNTKTITASKDWQTVILRVDQTEAKVNDEVHQLDVPAVIVNGRTLVPVRFIGEALGSKIHWDESLNTVFIASNKVNIDENIISNALVAVSVYSPDRHKEIYTVWDYYHSDYHLNDCFRADTIGCNYEIDPFVLLAQKTASGKTWEQIENELFTQRKTEIDNEKKELMALSMEQFKQKYPDEYEQQLSAEVPFKMQFVLFIIYEKREDVSMTSLINFYKNYGEKWVAYTWWKDDFTPVSASKIQKNNLKPEDVARISDRIFDGCVITSQNVNLTLLELIQSTISAQEKSKAYIPFSVLPD